MNYMNSFTCFWLSFLTNWMMWERNLVMGRQCLYEKSHNRQVTAKDSWTWRDLIGEWETWQERGLFTLHREHVHLLALVSPVHLERRWLLLWGTSVSQWLPAEKTPDLSPVGLQGKKGAQRPPGPAPPRQSSLGAHTWGPKLGWNQRYTESILVETTDLRIERRKKSLR